MRMRPKLRLVIVATTAILLFALVLLAAACGSSTPSSSSSSTSSASATTKTVDGIPITSDPSLKALLPASLVSANQIRCASEIDYPPWEYYVSPTNKQPTGFDYDLSQALAAKIGVPISFNYVAFDGIILALKGGKDDMAMSGMTDTAAREAEGVTFVDYALDAASLLVLKGNPKGITNLNSLSGKVVTAVSGDTEQLLLQNLNAQFKKAGKSKMTILSLPSNSACLLALTGGRAAVLATDHSTAAYISKTTNNGNTFEVVNDPAAPDGYNPAPQGIAITATDTGLVSAVQKALQDLIADGSYTKIIDKYGLLPVTSVQINRGTSS